MEFFASSTRISGTPETKKAAFHPVVGAAALGVSETMAFYSIETLRDGVSFPESCGERLLIESVLETVKWHASHARRFALAS